MKALRVVHYLNQFYGGIGGEDKADVPLSIHEGPVGPGRLLARKLGAGGRVVASFVCGDNAFHERRDETLRQIVGAAREWAADVLLAGPAFASGRYGLACACVAARVEADLGIPTVTGMHPENPGAESPERPIYIVPTGSTSVDMDPALDAMVRLASALASGAPVGPAKAEGYLPRGIRRNVRLDRPAAERAVGLLLDKLAGRPIETELPIVVRDRVSPPPPIVDLRTATIALVTEAGVVPRGNPDGLEAARATRWGRYSLAGLDDLKPGDYESVHGGYDNAWVHQDPDRVLPVDALRALEREGAIGRLYDEYLVTCGSIGNPTVMRRLGREMAQALVAAKVDGVVLPAT
jgi:betaine reductase